MTWIDPDDTSSNPTAEHRAAFSEIVDSVISRRTVLHGTAATAALTVFSGLQAGTAFASERGARGTATGAGRATNLLGFQNVPATTADTITLPPGYSWEAIAAWGEPIVPGGPAFEVDASNTAAEQLQQLGMGHDGMDFFPADGSSRRGLLCINHEYTTSNLLFPDGDADWDAEKTAKEKAAHGVTVIEVIRRTDGTWDIIDSAKARRITADTMMEISGPAAGHALLDHEGSEGGTRVYGTVNNCASGKTPWDTYVTCEENFNGYFHVGEGGQGSAPEGFEELFSRYGIEGTGFGYRWAETDESWRADLHPTRTNAFGWCVEIDPKQPHSLPKKRTAMGRFKHEGVTFGIGRGKRAVAYMGDDQRFDYFYKFVSAENWTSMLARNVSPLDEGTLFVARFDEDGSGRWLPLVHGEGPLTAENGFADQAEVLVKTRLAADLLGATPMDRPEWSAVNPTNQDVYFTCTNNSRRTEANAANEQTPNRDGHIIRLSPTRADHVEQRFTWDVFLVGGDGTPKHSSFDGGPLPVPPVEAAFGSPDGLAYDDAGRLWIQTDGGQPIACNDQMLAADPATGDVRRFLVGPKGCEVTGFTLTPDQRTLFINIQHPGDAGTPQNPTRESSWPFGYRPRPATVVITKDDGGVIGS